MGKDEVLSLGSIQHRTQSRAPASHMTKNHREFTARVTPVSP